MSIRADVCEGNGYTCDEHWILKEMGFCNGTSSYVFQAALKDLRGYV